MYNDYLLELPQRILDVNIRFTLDSFLQDSSVIPKCRRAPLGNEPLRNLECQKQIIAGLHCQHFCDFIRSDTTRPNTIHSFQLQQELNIINSVIHLNLVKECPELFQEKNFAFTLDWRMKCWGKKLDEEPSAPIRLFVVRD